MSNNTFSIVLDCVFNDKSQEKYLFEHNYSKFGVEDDLTAVDYLSISFVIQLRENCDNASGNIEEYFHIDIMTLDFSLPLYGGKNVFFKYTVH